MTNKSELLFFVFFAKEDGLVLRQFITLEAAREGCAELADKYVTCIVPVSVDDTYYWNGQVKSEYPVRKVRDALLAAHAQIAAGVPLDTKTENRQGIPTLGRMKHS